MLPGVFCGVPSQRLPAVEIAHRLRDEDGVVHGGAGAIVPLNKLRDAPTKMKGFHGVGNGNRFARSSTIAVPVTALLALTSTDERDGR
jgi:hypothetical protein